MIHFFDIYSFLLMYSMTYFSIGYISIYVSTHNSLLNNNWKYKCTNKIYQASNMLHMETTKLHIHKRTCSFHKHLWSHWTMKLFQNAFSPICVHFSPLPTVEILCRNTKPCRIATQFINADLLESFDVYSLFLINVRPATLPRYLYINLLLLSQL